MIARPVRRLARLDLHRRSRRAVAPNWRGRHARHRARRIGALCKRVSATRLHAAFGRCLPDDRRAAAAERRVRHAVTTSPRRRARASSLLDPRGAARILARRYHEEKLKAEAASRSKTSFLAHLSHDIRTPLNHIIGFADLMRQQTYGPLGDPRYLDYVETIKDSGERLLAFFASILDLAELEGGRSRCAQEPVQRRRPARTAVAARFRGAGAARRASASSLGAALRRDAHRRPLLRSSACSATSSRTPSASPRTAARSRSPPTPRPTASCSRSPTPASACRPSGSRPCRSPSPSATPRFTREHERRRPRHRHRPRHRRTQRRPPRHRQPARRSARRSPSRCRCRAAPSIEAQCRAA